jgi:FeS assembly SUF system protein
MADESPADKLKAEALKAEVIEVLKQVFDPEIPVNIYDMGLIYDIEIGPEDSVAIKMTLTSPMCPVAEMMPIEVEARVLGLPSVKSASVEIVWDPPWTPERMTEAARLESGMM